jgi:hypothetical protein
VVKEYLCLYAAAKAVAPGPKRAWMLEFEDDVAPGPKLLARAAPPKATGPRATGPKGGGGDSGDDGDEVPWKECLLHVHESAEVRPAGGAGGGFGGNDVKEPRCFETRVTLVTGRTHQIRAQFALLGAPLLHDSYYAHMGGFSLDAALSGLTAPAAVALAVGGAGKQGASVARAPSKVPAGAADLKKLVSATRAARPFAVPTRAIGLQAARIAFAGRDVRAGLPWWRRAPQAAPSLPRQAPTAEEGC